jgi:hypothetical protein
LLTVKLVAPKVKLSEGATIGISEKNLWNVNTCFQTLINTTYAGEAFYLYSVRKKVRSGLS